jgi:outer membrane protein assembly factor BamB
VVARIGEKDLLVTCADPWVIAYEPVSGKELWRADCLRGEIVASPAVGNGYVLVCNQGSALSAINPGGSGDVTKSAIAWKYEEDLPDIASPAADGDLVYMATSEGLVVCIDSKTGKKVWDHEYQASFHASPTVVGNRLVLLDSKGAMFVLETGRQFREISQGKFEEDIEATPAFAPGRMFVRGAKRLYCVGGK